MGKKRFAGLLLGVTPGLYSPRGIIQTGPFMRLGFSPLTAGLSYRQAFDLAAELGLFLEIAYDQHEMDPRLPGAKALAQMGRAAGVGFSLHLPFVDWNIASLVPAVQRLSLERTQKALWFGAEIGAVCGVLHTGLVPLRSPEALAQAHQQLQQALEQLELAIPVALENLGLSREDLLEEPTELQALLATHPRYGYCLDVGHALIQRGPGGPQEYHRLLRHRLIHLHLHDNHGQRDEHLPCGAGVVDWAWVRGVLRGFKGSVALEVTGGAEGVRRSLALLRNGADPCRQARGRLIPRTAPESAADGAVRGKPGSATNPKPSARRKRDGGR